MTTGSKRAQTEAQNASDRRYYDVCYPETPGASPALPLRSALSLESAREIAAKVSARRPDLKRQDIFIRLGKKFIEYAG